MNKPLVLCILDGCGVRAELDGNAFAIDYEDREKLRLEFESALANNDTYNAIYNETLEEVVREEYPKIFEEN